MIRRASKDQGDHGAQKTTGDGGRDTSGLTRPSAPERKTSAVTDMLATMSLADSTSSKLEKSIPDPALHQRQRSALHEEEMDENKVVKHTRRDSTAIGVTPSDPSALVDLFQEVESIGNMFLPEDSESEEDSETGSTTGEGEESSDHITPAAGGGTPSSTAGVAVVSGGRIPDATKASSSASASQGTVSEDTLIPTSGSSLGCATAADTRHDKGDAGAAPAIPASATTAADQKPHIGGAATKLWDAKQPDSGMEACSVGDIGDEEAAGIAGETDDGPKFTPIFGGPASQSGPHPEDGEAPPAYWMGKDGGGTRAEGEGVHTSVAEDGENKGDKEALPAQGRTQPAFGAVRRAQGAWKLSASESRQSQQSQQSQRPASMPAEIPPRQQMPPRVPSVKATSMGISEGDMSQSQAPLRRKTSMGSFQKGMGESLTGRLRKQLDIPKGPKLEINTNIPIEQIQSLKYLAQGAMCVAYTATLDGKCVVLKTPLPDTTHAEVAANDLEVEMLLLKELHHDNIVSLLGAGFLPDGRRFVALEYLSQGTLSSVLKKHETKPMSIPKVLDLSLALCNALEYLHDVAVPGRIVCHRDLKPDNIGIAGDGTLKLIDFGLGKIIKRKFRVRAEKYHMTGGTGSLRYMAPEIADHQEYNEKGDVYSFSLIMWEMLAGVKPFLGLKRPDFYSRVVDRGERPDLNPNWPLQVRNLLKSCWRTNLDERLSFREVAGILKVCAEEENQQCYAEEKRKSVRVSARRTRLWTTTGVRPDLDEISADPQYKPKFKISSFFSHHSKSTGGVQDGGSRWKMRKNVRRTTSDNA